MEDWDFDHFLVSPMDGLSLNDTRMAAIRFVLGHPRWRLSTQTHKMLGLR
jgi:organic radical activating enzyme